MIAGSLRVLKNIDELGASITAMVGRGSGDDAYHAHLAGDWLLRAQAAGKTGGYAHSYSLSAGWSQPYPETTGYVIPTMLRLSDASREEAYADSARRAGRWLLGMQLPDGSFPDLSGAPQVFDTGQIVEGLLSLYAADNDAAYLEAAIRAGEFLARSADRDGRWTRFSYNGVAHTYYARVAANLLKLYAETNGQHYKETALRNLDWVLEQQREDGYFDHMSFSSTELPFLHTIVYVLEGLWGSYAIIREERIAAALLRTVDRMALLTKSASPILHSQYGPGWIRRNGERCLAGLAQWAGLLVQLDRQFPGRGYSGIAIKTIDYLKSKQVRIGSDNIRGALPGSVPLWGSYFRYSFNNWTAKFFIDALLRSEALER